MEVFGITIDRKCTIWVRNKYIVCANNYKEAVKIATRKHSRGEESDSFRILEETLEFMSEKENYAAANCDILIPDDNIDTSDTPVVEVIDELSEEIYPERLKNKIKGKK